MPGVKKQTQNTIRETQKMQATTRSQIYVSLNSSKALFKSPFIHNGARLA